jgi:hypothetical protein
MLTKLGWNHDRNRPFRGMSAVFLFTILYLKSDAKDMIHINLFLTESRVTG